MRLDPDRLPPAFKQWSNLPQLALHQAGWWACVLWMGWQGPMVMLGFIFIHLWMLRSQWRVEVSLIALSTLLGLALDNALAQLGAVTYVGAIRLGWAPLWLVTIWSGFGATLRHSQAVFVRSLKHALMTGLLGGPLAYMGGEKLERMVVTGPVGWLWIGLLWGAVMVILYQAVRISNATND